MIIFVTYFLNIFPKRFWKYIEHTVIITINLMDFNSIITVQYNNTFHVSHIFQKYKIR